MVLNCSNNCNCIIILNIAFKCSLVCTYNSVAEVLTMSILLSLNSCFFVNRKVEFPLSWPITANIQKLKSVGPDNTKETVLVVSEDANTAAQNAMIEESTLLMKFCSISLDYTPNDRDAIEVDLPFELTNEQHTIITFPKSTFVLGRSGTGKTTVLSTKMIQNEKLHYTAVERAYGPIDNANEANENAVQFKRPVLRQLFVTLSPGLCQEIKHNVSCFKR